jgi:hypothetical protein
MQKAVLFIGAILLSSGNIPAHAAWTIGGECVEQGYPKKSPEWRACIDAEKARRRAQMEQEMVQVRENRRHMGKAIGDLIGTAAVVAVGAAAVAATAPAYTAPPPATDVRVKTTCYVTGKILHCN